jgi:hypothetical protein
VACGGKHRVVVLVGDREHQVGVGIGTGPEVHTATRSKCVCRVVCSVSCGVCALTAARSVCGCRRGEEGQDGGGAHAQGLLL